MLLRGSPRVRAANRVGPVRNLANALSLRRQSMVEWLVPRSVPVLFAQTVHVLQMVFRKLGQHGVRARKRAAVAHKHARVPVLHHATEALHVRTSVRHARATSVRAQYIAV